MRPLIIYFLLFSLSCSKKTDSYKLGYFSDVQINLDTLVIASNNEIIDTNRGLLTSDLSTDKKHLYNFNFFEHTLEQINLDELSLEKKIPFEIEGPNATGNLFTFISINEKNHMLTKDNNKSELFNLKGEKISSFDFENYSLGWKNGKEVRASSPMIDPNLERLYLLFYNDLNESFALGILNLETYEVSSIPLDSFEGFRDYTFSVTISKATINTPHGVYLEIFNGKLVLTSQVNDEFLIYDIEDKKLYPKSNSSQLYENRKLKEYQFVHESFESKEAEYIKFMQEINFLPPFWDEKNQVFYRFSYQNIPPESDNNEEIKSKVYLTALDKDLNMIGETFVPQLTKKPAKHFSKDGKIWIYENINDEMGFVVLTISK